MLSQALYRLPNQRVKLNAAIGQLGNDGLAHARVPEFPQVFLDPGDRGVLFLRLKETTDLVGHIGQFIMRHGEPSVG